MKKRESARTAKLFVPLRSPLHSRMRSRRHCAQFITNARRLGLLAPTKAFRECLDK